MVAALAVHDEESSIGDVHVAEAEAENLASTQAAQHHGQDHGPVPLCAHRPEQTLDLARVEDLGQRPGDAHQGDGS